MPIRNSWIKLAGLIPASAFVFAVAEAPGNPCWNTFISDLASCAAISEPPSSTAGPDAHATCVEGAGVKLVGCASNADGNALLEAWNDFNARLQECLSRFPDNEVARKGCIQGAFDMFRMRVRELQGLDPEPFPEQRGGDGGVQFGWPWLEAGAMMESTAVTRVKAGSTFEITGGLRRSANSGNFRSLDRAASAGILLAIYETESGFESFPVDAVTAFQTGARFSASFPAFRHVHSERVHLVGVYFDQQGVPVAAEVGEVMLHDSPTPGDWNRDGIVNTRDMLDFVRSFNAKVRRADLTGDGVVDQDDLSAFLLRFDR